MAHPPPLQPEYYNPGPPLPTGPATASMVCGIVSLVMLCAFFPIALPLAIVAVALGGRAQRDARLGIGGGSASAHAGVVCGSIVLILFGVVFIALLVAGVAGALSGK